MFYTSTSNKVLQLIVLCHFPISNQFPKYKFLKFESVTTPNCLVLEHLIIILVFSQTGSINILNSTGIKQIVRILKSKPKVGRAIFKCLILGNNVLRPSEISLESAALIVRYSQKKECISFFIFYCFVNLSIVITLESLI